ncbi:hypothetical protein IE81DRAFT_324279 [Ceraceosorus guamensis]|uniref:Uncharacterized protein n=1 Tax=Ceraceosorus guamensis TaxID=1522189 RepID=A0A316VZG3_9BASI|nr:hypothetical protein IE81DRAFT_324279 [Ceraceosorus guamensis]PWN41651.1 hypothetical protein IE81DRAFT_324279 [Ceraceosorus guamensis]
MSQTFAASSNALLQPSATMNNAAGLMAEHSLTLPDRVPNLEEAIIVQALEQLYSSSSTANSLEPFAQEVILTLPSGDVCVGLTAFQARFGRASENPRPAQVRLLETPESLPEGTMCLDVVLPTQDTTSQAGAIRNLVVLKRRAEDGKIVSMTEEEGHRRATAPLAARTAAASNFYSCSPTDNMVSPCTSKLNLSKKKHFMKGKPTTLFPAAGANSTRAPSKLNRVASDENAEP